MKKQQLSQEGQELIIRYINADNPCESCGMDISSCCGCPKHDEYKNRYIDPIYQYDYSLMHLAIAAKQIRNLYIDIKLWKERIRLIKQELKEDYIIDLRFLKDIVK